MVCVMDSFKYSRAIVCGVPSSLPAAALRQDSDVEPVNLDVAREQHSDYVNALHKSMGLKIITVNEDERFPDCVFVEDTVVVVGNTALLTIPGHSSRRGETNLIRETIVSVGLNVVEMKDPGTMDGGDVLFTGREFFVGLSSRTNEEGIAQLANAFPNYRVTPILVNSGLHLKSFCSMAGNDIIAIGKSKAAKEALETMKRVGRFEYQFLLVDDDKAANCVFANNVLIHVSNEHSLSHYDQLNCIKIPLSMSELNKVDGCFTCCSVLIP